MATLQLELKNGKIVEGTGKIVYPQVDENGNFYRTTEDGRRFVEANGWIVEELNQGGIKCTATRTYRNGEESIIYTIDARGNSKLMRKEGDAERYVVEKRGRAFEEGDELTGLIGLSGGAISNRYAYFRSAKFQNFLNEHGITQVVRGNPNGEYEVENNYSGWGRIFGEVYTDGEIDTEMISSTREEWARQNPGTCAWNKREKSTVSGATYAIVAKEMNYNDNHNHAVTLYTTQDIYSLNLGRVVSTTNGYTYERPINKDDIATAIHPTEKEYNGIMAKVISDAERERSKEQSDVEME